MALGIPFVQLMKQRKKSFVRMFYSCLLLYLIPLFLLGLLVNQYFFKVLNDNIMRNNEQALMNTSKDIGKELDKMIILRNSLIVDSAIQDHYNPQQYSQVTELKNKLRLFSIGDSFYQFIAFYCKGDDYLFTNNTSFRLSHFVRCYQVEGYSNPEDFRDLLNNAKEIRILKASNQTAGESLYFIVFPSESYNNKVIFVAVGESSLVNYLSTVFDSMSEGFAAIIDREGAVIASYSREPSLDMDGYLSIYEQTGEGAANRSVKNLMQRRNGREYVVNAFPISNFGWSLVTISQSRVILQNMIRLRMTWLFVLTGLLTVGLLFIVLAVRFNYLPLYRFFKKAYEIFNAEELGRGSGDNELGSIGMAMESLSKRMKLLQSASINQRKATMDYLVMKLFRGELDREDFNKIGRYLDATIQGDCYRVLVIHSATGCIHENSREYAWVLRHFDSLRSDSLQTVMMYDYDQNALAVALFYDEAWDRRILEGLRDFISSDSAGIYTAGVSRLYRDIRKMNLCWAEGKTVLSHHLVNQPGGRISWSDDIWEGIRPPCPLTDTAADLKRALVEQRNDRFYNTMLALGHSVGDKGLAAGESSRIVLGIARCIIDAFRYDIPLRFPVMPEEVPVLTHDMTGQESAAMLGRWRDDIFRALGNIHRTGPDAIVHSMVHYLEDNYSDCNFSIEQMACHFGMSLPALSQYFKDYTGETLNDRLLGCRIEEAKRLLLHSELPIKDVSLQVGYYHVSSFIRRFKHATGVTPGEYKSRQTG